MRRHAFNGCWPDYDVVGALPRPRRARAVVCAVTAVRFQPAAFDVTAVRFQPAAFDATAVKIRTLVRAVTAGISDPPGAWHVM